MGRFNYHLVTARLLDWSSNQSRGSPPVAVPPSVAGRPLLAVLRAHSSLCSKRHLHQRGLVLDSYIAVSTTQRRCMSASRKALAMAPSTPLLQSWCRESAVEEGDNTRKSKQKTRTMHHLCKTRSMFPLLPSHLRRRGKEEKKVVSAALALLFRLCPLLPLWALV